MLAIITFYVIMYPQAYLENPCIACENANIDKGMTCYSDILNGHTKYYNPRTDNITQKYYYLWEEIEELEAKK